MSSSCIVAEEDNPDLEDLQEEAVVLHYKAQTIFERVDKMVYVPADNFGMQFIKSGSSVHVNKYLFQDVDELPILHKKNIKVKVLEQKSAGTWILSIDGREYIINETDLRLITDSGEVVLPEKNEVVKR